MVYSLDGKWHKQWDIFLPLYSWNIFLSQVTVIQLSVHFSNCIWYRRIYSYSTFNTKRKTYYACTISRTCFWIPKTAFVFLLVCFWASRFSNNPNNDWWRLSFFVHSGRPIFFSAIPCYQFDCRWISIGKNLCTLVFRTACKNVSFDCA